MKTVAVGSVSNCQAARERCQCRGTLARRTVEAWAGSTQTKQPPPRTEAGRERLAGKMLGITLTLLERRGVSPETTIRVALGLLLTAGDTERRLGRSMEETVAWLEHEEAVPPNGTGTPGPPTTNRKAEKP